MSAPPADTRSPLCASCGHEKHFHSFASGEDSGDCMMGADGPTYCECEGFEPIPAAPPLKELLDTLERATDVYAASYGSRTDAGRLRRDELRAEKTAARAAVEARFATQEKERKYWDDQAREAIGLLGDANATIDEMTGQLAEARRFQETARVFMAHAWTSKSEFATLEAEAAFQKLHDELFALSDAAVSSVPRPAIPGEPES